MMNGLGGLFLAVSVGFTALPAAAQTREETLADIRQEMSVLFVEIQRLKRELSTTGAANVTVTAGSMLDRVDAIEAELTHLISKTENLEFRIDKIVKDGTNRIGDLEFRLVELEGGDVSTLGQTSTLGGGPAPIAPAPAVPAGGGGQMAMGEQTDFDAAMAALNSGAFEDAVTKFEAFSATYTGGPLSGEAHFMRGEALAGLGRISDAARAYLTSFSGSPSGPRAPDALFKLGTSLGDLGQTSEACVTLGEVEARFPNSAIVLEANSAMRNLGCN